MYLFAFVEWTPRQFLMQKRIGNCKIVKKKKRKLLISYVSVTLLFAEQLNGDCRTRQSHFDPLDRLTHGRTDDLGLIVSSHVAPSPPLGLTCETATCATGTSVWLPACSRLPEDTLDTVLLHSRRRSPALLFQSAPSSSSWISNPVQCRIRRKQLASSDRAFRCSSCSSVTHPGSMRSAKDFASYFGVIHSLPWTCSCSSIIR